MKKTPQKIILTISILIIILFIIRFINPRQIDDISPEIPCEQEYIEKSNVLWIIPNFNNKAISDNKNWCGYILSLNKTLGLHGVYHNHEEFQTTRNQIYLQQGINTFENCFNFKSELFKPSQLRISIENKQLIKQNNLELKTLLNQITHKVYHCDDSGMFSNKFIDLF